MLVIVIHHCDLFYLDPKRDTCMKLTFAGTFAMNTYIVTKSNNKTNSGIYSF